MSRPYKVTVRETLQETIVADDSVQSKLDILPILPKAETEEVARTILTEHGFEDSDDGSMCRDRGGVSVTINPGDGSISIGTSVETGINLSDEEDIDEGGCPCRVRNKEAVQEALRKRLAKKAAGLKQDIQEMVTGKLSDALGDLGCEMEQIAGQIMAKSLVRKARELGNIKRIHHNDDTGEMTVVVEVA